MTAPQPIHARSARAAALASMDEKPRKKRGTVVARPLSVTEARSRGTNTSTYEGAASIDPEKPLTDKQKAFVKFWAQGETIPTASLRAGYNDGASIAYRMVRMPNILKLYNREKRLYEEASQMSRKKVMDMLLEAYQTAKMVAEPASMVSAAREIGRMCGYYEPVTVRHQVSVEGKLVVERLNRMSDEDLLKFISDQAKEIALAPHPGVETPLLEDLNDTDNEFDGTGAEAAHGCDISGEAL